LISRPLGRTGSLTTMAGHGLPPCAMRVCVKEIDVAAENTSGPEMVALVDSRNRVVGEVARPVMRARNLPHRASFILVENGRGELLVMRRTVTKDVYPGLLEIAAGGVVAAGESYEESARREVGEELGVGAEGLSFLFDHYYGAKSNRVWCRIFHLRHEGPFVLQPEEVDGAEFMPIPRILAHDRSRFTPASLPILYRFISLIPRQVARNAR